SQRKHRGANLQRLPGEDFRLHGALLFCYLADSFLRGISLVLWHIYTMEPDGVAACIHGQVADCIDPHRGDNLASKSFYVKSDLEHLSLRLSLRLAKQNLWPDTLTQK
ncbi:MAG: hypothetical protein ACOYNZ_15360, partial [Rhodoferax sp.]